METENTITTSSVSTPSRQTVGGDVSKIDHGGGSNAMPLVLLWICAVIAIGMTAFLWLSNNSKTDALANKKTEQQKLQSSMATADFAATDTQISSFVSAVSLLKEANSKRYPMKDFLPGIFAKINQNVVVSTMSLTSEGKFTLNGTTDSYRGAAEQIMTLKEWQVSGVNVFKNIELASISMTATKDGKVTVPLSISADYTNTTTIPAKTESSVSSSSSSTTATSASTTASSTTTPSTSSTTTQGGVNAKAE
jgi:hypothetical protein